MGVIKKKKLKLPFRILVAEKPVEYKPRLKPDGSEYTLLELIQQSTTYFFDSDLLQRKVAEDYFRKESVYFRDLITRELIRYE